MKTNTYHFTSKQFSGVVVLMYNEQGALVSQDLTGAELNAQQINWFNNSMPKFLEQFKATLRDTKNTSLKRIAAGNVTFEQFWERYNEKTRSSKKKALQRWNGMTQTQRDRAFEFIGFYERNIPNGIAKKYAETYLNAELWNN